MSRYVNSKEQRYLINFSNEEFLDVSEKIKFFYQSSPTVTTLHKLKKKNAQIMKITYLELSILKKEIKITKTKKYYFEVPNSLRVFRH